MDQAIQKYGFIPAPHDHLLPLCLICMVTFSNENMKPCKMKKHLISVHPEKKDKPFEFFQKLRDTFQKRATLMHMVRERPLRLDDGIVASRIDEMAGDIEDQLICLPGSRTSSPVQNVHDKKLRRKGPRDKWSRAKLPMRQMVHGKNVH
ncbi:hypothetical protein M513_08612 [Trichuris suis]|uniref:BED-type domain-containing protein n=1 Tax=Trichuris suis TaxID=68888 RepID=A0A085LZZ8_9BILA|nr:hypothetical protein M513_08612 [Trichuris suis]